MTNSKTFQRWQDRQKAQTLKMLDLLAKRIKNGSLIVSHSGMWSSRLDSKVFIKIEVISKDSQEELEKFSKL